MIEYRTVNGGTVGADGGLTGMVTPFGVETVIGDLKRGGFREEIAPGTFTKTLQERAVVLIHNHDTAMPMASTAVPEGQEGHLSLTQEGDGLRASAPKPIDTTYTSDVRKLAKAGILGMSFGFEVTKDDWSDDQGRASNPQAGTKRIIREVKLHEASTTAFPAYGSTMGTVSARDAISAARGATETRSPKASYADVETCGDCGATGQYGSFCGSCGGSMSTSQPSSDFCTSCGSELSDDSRAAHVCAEGRAAATGAHAKQAADDAKDDAQGLAAKDAILDQALKLLSGADRNSLPANVNQAIDLLSGLGKQIDSEMKDKGVPDPDNSDNDSKYAEAGSATSDDDERADADLFAAQIRIEMEF